MAREFLKLATSFFAASLIYTGCGRPFTEDGYIQEFSNEVQKYHNDESYYRRGIVYITHGRTALALADFSKAISLSPKRAVLYASRAGAYAVELDWDAMLADLNRSIELDSENSVVHSTRAALLLRKKEYKKALSDLNLALKLNPKDFRAYETLGVLFFEMGDFEHAAKNLDKAVQLNSEDGKAYYFRAQIYFKTKNHVEGEKYLQLAKDKGFTGSEKSFYYGDQLAQVADYELALGDKGYVP